MVAMTGQVAAILSAAMPETLIPVSGTRSYDVGPYAKRRILSRPGGLRLVYCLPLERPNMQYVLS